MNSIRFFGALLMAGPAMFSLYAADPAAPIQATFVSTDSPEAKPYRDVGDRAIDRFAMTMITEASSSVARDGPVAALAVCHLKNLTNLNGFVSGVPRITDLKLTSLKLRNPANAPDAAEHLALEKVAADLEAGSPPNLLVQRIDLPGGRHEWRVYKPLAVIRQCMPCHGRADDQSAELTAALHERYPKDDATGYAPGQWRGLIRVTVSEPSEVKPPTADPSRAARTAKD